MHVIGAETKCTGFPFALVGLHSKPDAAVEELQEMDEVLEYTRGIVAHDNIIMLGDFNAGTDARAHRCLCTANVHASVFAIVFVRLLIVLFLSLDVCF